MRWCIAAHVIGRQQLRGGLAGTIDLGAGDAPVQQELHQADVLAGRRQVGMKWTSGPRRIT